MLGIDNFMSNLSHISVHTPRDFDIILVNKLFDSNLKTHESSLFLNEIWPNKMEAEAKSCVQ